MRVPIILMFFVLLAEVSCAQTGPGGVASTNGSSDLILWLSTSDMRQNGFINGDAINSWPDLSGYNSNATVSGNPIFTENVINNLPAIRFSRANTNYLEGTLPANASAPITIFVVGIFSGNPQIAGSGQYLIGLGGGSTSQATISREGDPSNQYYSFDGSARSLGPVVNSEWHLYSSQHNTTSPFHSLFIDNTLQVISNDYTTMFNSSNGNYSLGRNFSGLIDTYLDGDIAEVIIIDRILNDAERTISANYLSAKFNLPISGDFYSGDSNAAGDFDLHVAGVGTEANGSQIEAASSGLILIQNSGIENGDYLIFGHRSPTNSINTFDIAEVGNTLVGRWSRTWFVDATDANAAAHVDVTFDFSESGISLTAGSASNYRLVRLNGSDWDIISSSASVLDDRVTFENLQLVDGIYTLASTDLSASPLSTDRLTGTDGPAGLGATGGGDGLQLWLDASRITGLADGANVPVWNDLALTAQSPTQPSASLQPQYVANMQNGLPVVNFDGADDFLQGNLGNLDAPMTIMAVARFNQSNQGSADNDYVFDLGLGSPMYDNPGIRASISRRRNDDVPARTNRYYSFAGDYLNYGPVIQGNEFHVFTSVYQTASPFHQLYLNGALAMAATGTTPLNTNGIFHLGRLINEPGDYYLNGDIAEIAVYNTVLNPAEIAVLQNSLSAKWNTTISNDYYSGDTPANGNNDLSVSGVGRLPSADMAEGNSSGMHVRLSANAASNSFILFGHNLTTNSIALTDNEATNGTITERVARTWYLTVTGATGDANSVQFDYSEMGIAGQPSGSTVNFGLLFRDDVSDDWTIIATATSLSGDQVNFENVNLAATGNGFYSLGSLNGAALPVALLSFNAVVVEETKNNPKVLLTWSTSVEKDNHFFTIERSANGQTWLPSGTIPAKQKPGVENDYSYTDAEPLTGRSYYRLRQTDFDGTSLHIGEVRTVILRTPQSKLNVFPNPVTESFRISSTGFEPGCRFYVTNATGRVVYDGIADSNEFILPQGMPVGVYHLSITSGVVRQSARFVVKK